MKLDILSKNVNQFENRLDNYPKTKIYSYQSSYSNNNGKKKFLKKKIISDGNYAKVYKNINGKEYINNIKYNDLSRELSIPNIKLYNILRNSNILPIKHLNNNTNSNINQFLLLSILIFLIYISIKLTIKK